VPQTQGATIYCLPLPIHFYFAFLFSFAFNYSMTSVASGTHLFYALFFVFKQKYRKIGLLLPVVEK